MNRTIGQLRDECKSESWDGKKGVYTFVMPSGDMVQRFVNSITLTDFVANFAGDDMGIAAEMFEVTRDNFVKHVFNRYHDSEVKQLSCGDWILTNKYNRVASVKEGKSSEKRRV